MHIKLVYGVKKACLVLVGIGVFFLPRTESVGNTGGHDTRFMIVAHRGGTAVGPENTLRTYKRAVELGADMIEIDVRLSKDGELFILHDATLDRTTNGSGPASNLTLEELKQLDAGSWYDHSYSVVRIPSFEEVLAWAKVENVLLLLDLKESGRKYIENVARAVNQYNMADQIVLGIRSTHEANLFRTLLPVSRQLGFIRSQVDIEAYGKAGVDVIRLWLHWLQEDPSLVNRVRTTGAKLMINGTLGGLKETTVLLGFSPEWILIDDPARLINSLRTLNQ